jgi:hypothetical protein
MVGGGKISKEKTRPRPPKKREKSNKKKKKKAGFESLKTAVGEAENLLQVALLSELKSCAP